MKGLVGRFEKTAAGRQEIASRIGTLDRRTRALLITVDGRTSVGDLLARALQLGLESDAVFALQQEGFIQHVGELGHVSGVQPSAGSLPSAAKQKMQFRKRSLAAARMYLMDVMVRTLGTAEHPIRTRLIEATDPGSVEQAFEAFLEMLHRHAIRGGAYRGILSRPTPHSTMMVLYSVECCPSQIVGPDDGCKDAPLGGRLMPGCDLV